MRLVAVAGSAFSVGSLGVVFMKSVRVFLAGMLALIGALLALPAMATSTAVDVTATVTGIADQLVPIGLLGVACLGIYVAVKAFHWVRRAMS